MELGMRVDPDAPLRIRLNAVGATSVVKGAKSKGVLIRAVGTYRQSEQYQEEFSYLRNFQETPYQTARDILWALTVHAKVPVRVIKQGDNWLVDKTALPALWDFNGRYLSDGKRMIFAAKKTGAANAMIDGADFPNVCGDKSRCILETASIKESSPVFGWQRLHVKLTGKVDPSLAIFVSGYQAQIDGHTAFYWGIPGGSANVTAMLGDKVILRKRLVNDERSFLALPGSIISKR